MSFITPLNWAVTADIIKNDEMYTISTAVEKSTKDDFECDDIRSFERRIVKIDNAKYKAFFGTKAKMLSYDEAEALIGHAVGGVCPFAVNEGVEVYLDESLKRFITVFPACGSSNSAIELTMEELEKYSGYVSWIDVCKARNE